MSLIPLTRSENRVLDKVTNDHGWFDEEAYLEEMKKARLYVTKRQKTLLTLIPQRYEQGINRKKKLISLGYFLGETFMLNRF